MIGPYRIEGYVIASADGMIADETGVMPLSLQLDADKRYFEEALEHVEAVVHGRRSQEIQPKSAGRRRLILTRRVKGLAPHPENPMALLWNPAGASFEEACAALGVSAGKIAVIGGPLVYSLFLKTGYDAFHLCRAVNVKLPGGLPVFARDRFGGEPEAALKGAGLKAAGTLRLDDEVSLTDWGRPGGAAA
jgi:dihydrofolate reductase